MNKLISVQLIAFSLCSVYGHNGSAPQEEDSQLAASSDAHLAETGFAGAVQSGSKYFQYAHVPDKDHYEVGHKRGNEHHFIERHEKAHPHEGEFKTKVRWGDKHGGYGEHYWDYNHDGHGNDGHDEEESQQHESYAPYEKPETANRQRRAQEDVEIIDLPKVMESRNQKHGGNYRVHPKYKRTRRQHN